MARAAGMASKARQLRKLAAAQGWAGRVAGTRKTTPGFVFVPQLLADCERAIETYFRK